MSLPVPPPGILRTSSPGDSGPDKPDPDPERSRSRSYNVRSDTVLEMCSDIEDISFIDEDPEDEVSGGKDNDEVGEAMMEDTASLGDDNTNIDKQQIVIKLNNEIELTSIVLNTRPLSENGGKIVEEESQSVKCQENGGHGKSDVIHQVDLTYDEISETSFNIACDVSLQAPIASSSSSSETVSSRGSCPGAAQPRAPGSGVMKRRSVLVRQNKLRDSEHPDNTRQRHSWVACHTSYKPTQVGSRGNEWELRLL